MGRPNSRGKRIDRALVRVTTWFAKMQERDREKMAELMFEKFDVPAYFVSCQSVLSL